MKILITGASSYVGARIFFDLQEKYELVGTYFTNQLAKSFVQLNLTDKHAVEQLFEKEKPEVIVHVANFPSPRSAVNNEDKFVALNDKTTRYVVENANKIGSKVVFISSQAANNPRSNMYGELKLKSERLIKSVKAGYLILRPSLLVGFSPNTVNSRPFNRILFCLDNKEVVGKFDTSWRLQPSYVGHLSQVIEKTIQSNKWNQAVPIFIDELVTQHQIAKDILSIFEVDVNPIDQGIDIAPSDDDLTYLYSLNLKPRTYQEMINTIQDEISRRKEFVL